MGGPPRPHRDSSSLMGGPPDPQQKSSSSMGGPPDPCGNSSSNIDEEFHENFHSSKIELGLKAFEDHALNEGHNLRDDSSYSSSESHASKHTDFSSCDRIDRSIEGASEDLDRLTDEILCLDFEEQGFHSHSSPTTECKDIFEHVLVEPLSQLDMKSYFFEEKTKPEANHLPLKKRLVWKGDSATTSDKCAAPTSECATHESICATPVSDFEELRSNCITFDFPSKEVISNSEIDNFCIEASQGMGKKVAFAVPSSIEGRCEIKCSQDYSPEIPSQETLHSSKDFEKPVAPFNSKTSHPIEPETSPAKVNPHDFITPMKVKKVSFKEDNTSRIMTPLPRIITPSSSQPTSRYAKKKKTQLVIVTSTLIASTFTCNAKSESVFRPKRRTSKAPPTQEVFPPLKKSPSSSFEMRPSSSSKCSSRNAYESNFKHLKNSRFVSTSFIFRKRDAAPNENISSSTSNAYPSFSKCSTHCIEGISKFDPSTNSSPIFKDNLDSKYPPSNSSSCASHHFKKKILGPAKTLDLSEPKTILRKSSGSNKTFSLSCLEASTCGKPKVKATKHPKSSFKTKPNNIISSTYFSRSSSGTRNLAFLKLIDGDLTLYFIPAVSTFIIALLVYLLLLKLLHLPFDRGKETFILFN